MIYAYQFPIGTLIEIKPEGGSEIVAVEIRSDEDGRLLASAPQLREGAQQGLLALEWIRDNVAHMQLPTELQPIGFHIDRLRGIIGRTYP